VIRGSRLPAFLSVNAPFWDAVRLFFRWQQQWIFGMIQNTKNSKNSKLT
jgi:hypothetical protein